MSSDEELVHSAPNPRIRRHKFKNFAERVADVDVDAFRRLGPVRETPLFGASSWTQETLIRWRELNSAEHFLALAAQLTPLCETLPQLVHHAEQAFQHIMASMHMRALLSLPANMALLAAFARDLQGDFATRMLPRALDRLTALINIEGGDREPELLESAFNCLALLCKHLARFLLPELPAVLRMSAELRYARAPHVRAFAAQAFGFLLRLAAAAPDAVAVQTASSSTPASTVTGKDNREGGQGGGVLHSTLRALLAEHALRPSEEVTDGAGRLIGEAVLGVGHGLHSRAPLLLGMALGEDVLKSSDFVSKRTGAGKEMKQEGDQGSVTGLGREVLRARATAVGCVALDCVLVHLRRGRCQDLWDVLLAESHTRLDKLEALVAHTQQQPAQQLVPQQDTAGGSASKRSRSSKAGTPGKPATAHKGEEGGVSLDDKAGEEGGAHEVVASARSAARSVALVAQAVHHFRGSRVESYDEIQKLVARLMQPWAWWVGGAPPASAGAGPTAGAGMGGGPQSLGVLSEGALTQGAGRGDVEMDDSADQLVKHEAQQQQPQIAGGSKKKKRKLAQFEGSGADGFEGAKAQREPVLGCEPFLRVSLPQQILRLLLGVIYGHSKAVGASEGLPGLARYATLWSPAFSRPTPSDLLPFLAAMLAPPAGGEVARLFGPRLLGALGGVVLSSHSPLLVTSLRSLPQQHQTFRDMAGSASAASPAPPSPPATDAAKQAQRQQLCALSILVDACHELEGGNCGSISHSMPLLLTAQPGGVKLAAAVEKGVVAWVELAAAITVGSGGNASDGKAGHRAPSMQAVDATPSKKASNKAASQQGVEGHMQLSNHSQAQLEGLLHAEQLAAVWAGLQLLPHASQSRTHAVGVCERVKDATCALCGLVQATLGPDQQVPGGALDTAVDARQGVAAALVCLHALSLELLAELLPAATAQHVEQAAGQQGRGAAKGSNMAPQQLVAAAVAAVAWLKQQCLERRVQLERLQQQRQQAVAARAQAGALRVHPQHAQQDAQVSVGGTGTENASSLEDGAILWAARGVAAVLGAARRHAMHLPQAQSLLSVTALEDMLQELAPFLAHEQGTMRASVLRVLCCYDQPMLLTAPQSETAAPTPSNSGKVPRAEVLELLRAIACDPCSLEAGRRWSVALICQGNHIEYGRLSPFMVPVLAYGLIGVLRVRFSPLWPATVQALAACLQFQTKVCWPIVRDVIAATQQEFFSGGSQQGQQQHLQADKASFAVHNASARSRGWGRGSRGGQRGGRGGRYGGARPKLDDGSEAEDSQEEEEEGEDEEGRSLAGLAAGEKSMEAVEPLDGRFQRVLSGEGVGSVRSMAEVSGEERGSTDAGNRLTHLLRAMAGVPSQVVEPLSKEWVHLLLAYAAAPGSAASSTTSASDNNTPAAPSLAATTPAVHDPTQGLPAQASHALFPHVGPVSNVCQHASLSKVSGEEGEGEGEAVSMLSRVGTRNYHAQLLEWLSFLAGVKGARGLYRASEIQVAVALHLDADEPKVQASALKCLQAFKLKYLNQHLERLLRLADNSTLREELALFPLAPNAEGGVLPEHRPGLMPLLIRLLFPKLRKRSGRLAGKGALGSARAAILNFLASAEPKELRPLLEAFLEPLSGMFVPPSAPPAPSTQPTLPLLPPEELAAADTMRLLPVPWWLIHVGSQPLGWWMAAVHPEGVAAQHARRKVGFLNAFEDLLEHLGHRLQPLLPVLLAITLRLLQQATAPVASQQQQQQQQQSHCQHEQQQQEGEGAEMEDERSREIRSSCLKILSQVWLRFPDAVDYSAAWPEFLPAIQPLLPRLLMEAAADKEPPLLSCAFALSASPHLLTVLGNMPSTIPGHTLPLIPNPLSKSPTEPAALVSNSTTMPATSSGTRTQGSHDTHDASGSQQAMLKLVYPQDALPGWAQQGMGGALMRSCIAMLTAKRCSQASRVTVLDMVDSILEYAEEGPEETKQAALEGQSEGGLRGPAVMSLVLEPWLDELLVALKTIVTAAWEGKSAADAKQAELTGEKPKADRIRSRGAHRELAVLEKLGGRCSSPSTALLLGDALAALIAGTTSNSSASRSGKSKLDEVGLAHALGALSALWGRLAAAGGLQVACGGDRAIGNDTMWRYWETMSGLALRLSTRDARASLASAFVSAAQLLDGVSPEAAQQAAATGAAQGGGPGKDGKAPMAVDQGPAASFGALRAARLLEDLTSWRVDTVDEMDYEKRLEGYKALSSTQWAVLGRRKALPLLLAAHHDCRNPADLALRQAASQALESFVEGVKQQRQQGSEVGPDEELAWLVPRVMYPQLKSQLSSSSITVRQEHLLLLRTLVLQCPDRFFDLVPLASPQDPETDFYLNIAHVQLHRRSRALMRMGRLADAMASEQQQPQQGQQGQAANGSIGARKDSGSLRCLLDIAVPLLQVVISEGGDAKDSRGGHERDQVDADREANVVDAAMGALGAVARALPWHHYDTLLSQFMRAMKAKTTKANIRAVCIILDAFHFPLPHNLEAPQHAAGTAPQPLVSAAVPQSAVAQEEGAEGESDEDAAGADQACVTAAADKEAEAQGVQRALLQRVLPVLHKLLVQGGPSPVVRAPVALALVKLLRLLPSEAERVELPRALQGICNLLADRQQRVRDDARHVLVAVAKELGPAYLPYICNVLRAALPDKGFTAHVIGYTLHAVLDALVGKLMTARKSHHAAATAAAGVATADGNEEPDEWAAGPEEEGGGSDDGGGASGALDDAVDLALPIIENEIFGEVAEAKEVAQFAMNYKEAKKVRGYESYMLLAAGVTFKTSMAPLLDLVRTHLHRASSPSVRNKLSQLLQHAARGVHANPTAGPTTLAVWVHGALSGALEREEAARERSRADVQGAASQAAEHGGPVRDAVAPVGHIIQSTVANSGKATRSALSPEDAAALHEYLIMDFALQLLHSSLRRGTLSGRSPATLGLLDPLLDLMVRALRCRHSGSVGLALRCLTILVGLPLPSLAQASGAAGKGVTALLRRAPNASHPVALEGFRLLAALMRQCSAYQPTTAQLRFLLSWLFSDRSAEDSAEVGPAFALLRAILGRRLVVPEVYDVMNWVQGLMVKSHSPQVRATCASALLQFLLDYPLGARRTAAHLSFLATNLSFEHEAGRLAVLDMVQQVVSKFPVEVTTAHAELFLLPLVMRLVNDPSPKCRAAVAGALRSLLAALPAQEHDKFASYCKQWLLGDNSALRRAAAQSLGLLAQVEGKRFGQRLWSLPSSLDSATSMNTLGAAGSRSMPLAAPVLACLARAAAASAGEDRGGGGSEAAKVAVVGVEGEEGVCGGGAGNGEGVSACAGWHEAYYCLLMLEKVMSASPSSLDCSSSPPLPSHPSNPSPSSMWDAVVNLLLHRHVWVRKAAARVLGAGLASPKVSEGLLGVPVGQQTSDSRAPRIAFSLFLQLDNEAADEVLCGQAVKCLVPIASALSTLEAASPQHPHLQQQQQQQQRHSQSEEAKGGESSEQEASSSEGEESGGEGDADDDGTAGAAVAASKQAADDAGIEDDDEDGGQDVPMASQYQRFAFTLRGLVKRMARLADNARFGMRQQRMAALRWLGAVAAVLGAEGMAPFLDVVMVPLYRLSEAKSSQQFSQGARQGRVVDEEAVTLADEVLAHLRTLVGSDTLLASYNAARESIKSRRTDRRRKASVKAMLDPEAAAAARLKRGRKKAEGRRRKMDDTKRRRSAQTYVGPKKFRGGGGGGGVGKGSSRNMEGAAAGAHKHAPKRHVNNSYGGVGKRARY